MIKGQHDIKAFEEWVTPQGQMRHYLRRSQSDDRTYVDDDMEFAYRAWCEQSARIDELERTFDLRWKADMRASKRWQQATGKKMVLPDHADLCVWLLERVEALEAQAK